MKNYTICKSDMVRFIQHSENVEWGTHAKAKYFNSLAKAKEFAKNHNLFNVQFQEEI